VSTLEVDFVFCSLHKMHSLHYLCKWLKYTNM
jgi:hypothetical protein